MSTRQKPVFTNVLQISIVVDDIDAYMKKYNDDYGIGPWVVLNFDKDSVSNMTVRGQKVDYSMKLALCEFFNVQWELIQPTDDKSVYAEFLKQHGPGLHHVALDTPNGYAQLMEDLAAKGHGVMQSGVDAGGMEFSYVDLTKDLGMIVELCNPPENFVPPTPEKTYPPKK